MEQILIKGNIVKIKNGESNDAIGYIADFNNKKNEYIVKPCFKQNKIIVCDEDILVEKDNITIINLSNDDNRKGYIEYLYETQHSNNLFSENKHNLNRIPFINNYFQEILKENSDLRLGQLKNNIVGNSDIFSIEDNELVNKNIDYKRNNR